MMSSVCIDPHQGASTNLMGLFGGLEGLSGLQQTTLQHCQDKIAGLEETVVE